MRALRAARLARTVIFVAFSGHELGLLGMHAFVDRRPDIISTATSWIHFGANIGAAIGPGNRLAASSDEIEKMAAAEMASAKLELGGAELYPVDGGVRTRIVASVKNGGEALKRVRIQLLDGEKCIDECGEPQSFEPGQGRRLIFTGPAALEPGRLRVRAIQW